MDGPYVTNPIDVNTSYRIKRLNKYLPSSAPIGNWRIWLLSVPAIIRQNLVTFRRPL